MITYFLFNEMIVPEYNFTKRIEGPSWNKLYNSSKKNILFCEFFSPQDFC